MFTGLIILIGFGYAGYELMKKRDITLGKIEKNHPIILNTKYLLLGKRDKEE